MSALIVDVFAAAGITAHEQGVLPDALRELSVRLDIKGAGGLLAEIMRHEFTEPVSEDEKRDPKPVPTPKPPPKPDKPKGCDGGALSAQCMSNRRCG